MAERTGRAPSAWTNRASPLNEQQLPQLVLARSVCGEVRFLSSALRVGSVVADAPTIAPDPPRQHGHRAPQIEESDLPRDIEASFAGRTHIRTGFGERRSRQWRRDIMTGVFPFDSANVSVHEVNIAGTIADGRPVMPPGLLMRLRQLRSEDPAVQGHAHTVDS